jgi:hypothetical protein
MAFPSLVSEYLNRCTPVIARVTPSTPDLNAWVWVCRLDHDPPGHHFTDLIENAPVKTLRQPILPLVDRFIRHRIYRHWIYRYYRTSSVPRFPGRSKQYYVRWVEAPDEVIRWYKGGVDIDIRYHATHYERFSVKTEEELEHLLSRWVKDFNDLGPTWRSDYPF